MIHHRAKSLLINLTTVVILTAGCQEPPKDFTPAGMSTRAPTSTLQIEITDLSSRVATDQPAEGLLGQPRFVRLDPAGQLFVVDIASLRIKVYSRDGMLRRMIGGRGRELGRFLTINSFHIDGAGRLIVADGSARRITVFSNAGQVLFYRPLDPLQMLWPRQLKELADGRLLFLCHMPGYTRKGERRPDADYLFHPYDAGLEHKLTAFAPIADISSHESEAAGFVSQVTPGSFSVLRGGAVLFAPSIYGGQLIRYGETDDGWREDERLTGYVPDDASVIELDPNRAGKVPRAIRIQDNGKPFLALVRHQSRGLFELSDGRIVHFSTFEIDGRRVFGAEVWDVNDAFLGYGPIESSRGWRSDHLFVDWKDTDDTFYLREMSSEPQVYSLRLDFH